MFGHDASLDKTNEDKIKIKRVTINGKEQILKELDKIGFRKSTIFPGLENVALEITNKYETLASVG